MKALVTAVMLAFASFAVQAAEPAKKAETKQEDNCVKKDKNGKDFPWTNYEDKAWVGKRPMVCFIPMGKDCC